MPQANKNNVIAPVHLLVLGSMGAGKSTFIQRALDLRQLPSTRASAKKMSLDGIIYLVRLIEMPLDDVVFSKGRFGWPKTIDNVPMPSIDGVMVLYDVTNRSSVTMFDELLSLRPLQMLLRMGKSAWLWKRI